MSEAMIAPPPATEAVCLALNESGVRCELIDGVIVRKPMGAPESFVAAQILGILYVYLLSQKIGFAYAPDAPVRFAPDLILQPDVALTARSRCPGGKLPRDRVATIIPNLAVEVLSQSNRVGEMNRKLAAYFAGGVELVWVIDPATRSAKVYTSPEAVATVGPAGCLDGGTVLPGFTLPLTTLFEEFD